MRLKEFQITKYKSIDDSNPIDVGDVVCLVGKNEAGKTAILEALAKLNPVGAVRPTFSLEDYPRRRLNAYKREHEEDPATAVRAEFEIEASTIEYVNSKLGDGVLRKGTFTVEMDYQNSRPRRFEFSNEKLTAAVLHRAGLPQPELQKLEGSKTLQQLLQAGGKIEEPSTQLETLLTALGKKGAAIGRLRVLPYLSIPEFFYFDDYSTLPGRISLRALQAAAAEEDSPKELHTAICLLDLVGASPEEFLQRDNYERLKADLEAASNAISDEIFEYWSQNRELEVEFDLEPKLNESNQLTDTLLHIRIKNRRHRVTVPFDERSKGFVWFFSFLVAFSRYRDHDEPVILLLDEPGVSLHARAQNDLLKFIDEKLAPKHQVIYTTHSPFMIAPGKLERVRTVQDVDDEGTRVSNDPLRNDGDTLFPLQAALGYELAQTLFVAPNVLLVEGPSDLIYLTIATERLQGEGREGLSDNWSIVPVGGADRLSTFVTLLGAQRMNVAVLMDCNHAERQRLDRLESNIFVKETQLVKVSEFTEAKQADIEDLFERKAFLKLVNQTYAEALGQEFKLSNTEKGNPRIIKRLEGLIPKAKRAKVPFSHYRLAAELLSSPKLQEALYCEETLARFERICTKVNALLK